MKKLDLPRNKTIVIVLSVIASIAVTTALSATSSAPSLAEKTTAKEVQGEGVITGGGKSLFNARATHEVWAGWGGHIGPRTAFFPKSIEIKAGENVTWVAISMVREPHTVTFIMDPNYTIPGVDVAPYTIPSSVQLTPEPQGSNSEAVVIPSEKETKTVMALNARSWSPVAIDADGNVRYMDSNATYFMTGNERYVNSGWLWPGTLTPPGSGGSKFSITFEKAGTYSYICIVHPWMVGAVVVKD